MSTLTPRTIKKKRGEDDENKEESEEPEIEPRYKWTRLFKKLRFFKEFNHFIKIDILSNNHEAHIRWLGYVESQLRRLFQLLNDQKDIS